LKILFIDNEPIRRGAQIFVKDLSLILGDSGHQNMRIYLSKTFGTSIVELREEDVVLSFSPNTILEKLLTFNPIILFKLVQLINSVKPEVILFNGAKSLKYGGWLRLLGLSRNPVMIGRFIDNADYWNPKTIKTWAYKIWINKLDGVIGVSNDSLNSFLKKYSFRKSTKVIHRSFDPTKFRESVDKNTAKENLGIEACQKVILFLGSLTTQKRPDRFLEVMMRVMDKNSNAVGIIVGDGVLRHELERKVSADKVLGKRIIFFGEQNDVGPFINASDIHLLTSGTEGIPGVVLEAAFFKVPTIASDVGGLRECVIHEKTGFLVDSKDIEGIVQKVNFLLSNEKYRLRMGFEANSLLKEKFDMNLIAKDYIKFFSDVKSQRALN